MPTQNNTSGEKSLFVSGLKLYNGIPEDIKREEIPKKVFKKHTL
jgi:hypothetical protein